MYVMCAFYNSLKLQNLGKVGTSEGLLISFDFAGFSHLCGVLQGFFH